MAKKNKIKIGALLLLAWGLSVTPICAKNVETVKIPVECKSEGKNDSTYLYTLEKVDAVGKTERRKTDNVEESKLFLKAGDSEDFVIQYEEPGEYFYEIRQQGPDNADMDYDETVYSVDVSVKETKNGGLESNVSIYDKDSLVKKNVVAFTNKTKRLYNPAFWWAVFGWVLLILSIFKVKG